eukprot:jgi/Mesvir1/14383/Mv09780-RA.1
MALAVKRLADLDVMREGCSSKATIGAVPSFKQLAGVLPRKQPARLTLRHGAAHFVTFAPAFRNALSKRAEKNRKLLCTPMAQETVGVDSRLDVDTAEDLLGKEAAQDVAALNGALSAAVPNLDPAIARELMENGPRSSRRTKIICTIGPSSCSTEVLEKMMSNGMNVVRLNMCHNTHEWHADVIDKVHRLNAEKGYAVAIMLDTEGSEVHIGNFPEPIRTQLGDTVTFSVRMPPAQTDDGPKQVFIRVNYDGFINDVQVGDMLMVDGGMVCLEVAEMAGPDVICKCIVPGLLLPRANLVMKREGKTIRGSNSFLPTISSKDWLDIDFAIAKKVDFICVSYVKSPDVIKHLKSYVKARCPDNPAAIIAKIESLDAVRSIRTLDEIIRVSDGVMVARGDLGAQIPLEEVPSTQAVIVTLARQLNRPVIVASQLLESMIQLPTPTRAEVADVTAVVRQRADALMLCGETAAGKYPERALRVIRVVANRIERSATEEGEDEAEPLPITSLVNLPEGDVLPQEICKSAALLANKLKVTAIFCYTRRGYLGALLSRCRPNVPIFAFTESQLVRVKMNLKWGLIPFRMDFNANPEINVTTSFKLMLQHKLVRPGDLVVVVSDIAAAAGQVIESIQVRVVPSAEEMDARGNGANGALKAAPARKEEWA